MEIRESDLNLKSYPIVDDKQYCVSTVSLCVDHGYDGRHLWYETMIFDAENDQITSFQDKYCDRYETRKQAIEGHDNIVNLLSKNELELY